MSWNGATPNGPNWQGADSATGGGGGDLYIVPDPPSIAENPSIGIEGRNEVPLPLAYKDLAVENLTATNINGNPDFDASNWYLYPANGNVTATLNPLFDAPQWDISGFEQISCVTLNTTQNVECGNTVNAVLGQFGAINCPDILMSPGDETGTLALYGANKIAGQNALYVDGGTTLTGGGVVHGVTIGALNVGGIDTVRIDVLPAGIDITSATFVATTAAGAASLVAGGALALAGGSYISYNSDQHYFTNTSAGNDYTDIFVGNIHAADGGSAPLRINDAGRGVELADVKSMTMTTQLPIANWVNSTSYSVGQKVKLDSVYYNCVVANAYTQPNIPIPNWVSASNYIAGTIVFSAGLVYRCLVNVSGSTTAPASDPTNWTNLGFTTNVITQIWSVFNPFVANIIGDTLSNITIGNITAPVEFVKLNASGGLYTENPLSALVGFNYVDLVAQTGSDATIYFNDSNNVLQSKLFIDNTVKRLNIESTTGLTINTTGATTTNFSAKDVENVKTLTLTSTIATAWNVANPYADGDEVEYDGGNWISQFGVNQQNTPLATLENWDTSGYYYIGAVRYYATDNNAYRCILGVFGASMPTPDTDPTHWSVFQVGSNGEDVWFPTTAPVVSSIIGDRVSVLEIGTIACKSDGGSYLEISPDAQNDANGLVQSAGALGLIGDQGVQIGAANSDVSIISVIGDIQLLADGGGVAINGNTLVGLEASVGGVVVNANTDVDITATQDATIQALNGTLGIGSVVGATNIESGTTISITGTTGVSIDAEDDIDITTTTVGDVNITAADNINLTAGAADINLTTTTGSTNITSGGEISLEATGGNIRIRSTTADLILRGETSVSLNGGTSNIVNFNSNNLTNVGTINGYNPPLTIYKNATIGSAISRAAATAEVQVYQQTMTLKANTQYNINISYSLLTENAGTATPNNNYYIIYRIHGGTSPLTVANMYSAPGIVNNTQIAGGNTQCFMTGSLTTYTGRFYIRNQNATVALTIANLQASVIEVF